MDLKSLQDIQHNELVRKRLAKVMALHCFRNTAELEDLHAGKTARTEAGDYSDVKVVCPRIGKYRGTNSPASTTRK
jgi:hypothetical protein